MGGRRLTRDEVEVRCLDLLRHFDGGPLSMGTFRAYITPVTRPEVIRSILEALVDSGLLERREPIGAPAAYALASRVEPDKPIRRRSCT